MPASHRGFLRSQAGILFRLSAGEKHGARRHPPARNDVTMQ